MSNITIIVNMTTMMVEAIVLVIFSFFIGLEALVRPDYANHPCKRTCQSGSTMTCNYSFYFEYIYTMEPNCLNCMNGTYADCLKPECIVTDGGEHLVTVYNRKIPGPAIEVCLGDQIVVDLINLMPDLSTTIHWHGIHQRQTPYMDGVPYVTQCPILPGNTFRYNFTASDVGTHWYHSHIDMQRVNGAFGALIVRIPSSQNPLANLYDFDLSGHVISVAEWFFKSPDEILYEDYRLRQFPLNVVSAMMVNGFGSPSNNSAPPARFYVQKGFRYRFRLINVGNRVCPVEVKIDGHNMTVIASDGEDFQPVTVERLFITNGERFDFILNANQAGQLYWMRFRGLMDCENVIGTAVLDYGQPVTNLPPLPTTTASPNGLTLNCINTPINVSNCIDFLQLRALQQINSDLTRRPDYQYFFALDTYFYALPAYEGVNDSTLTTPVVNNISITFPPSALLQNPQTNLYCNAENMRLCPSNLPICQCLHLIEIPLNSLVEFIIVDQGTVFDLSHPIHLHGLSFIVVGQDRLGRSVFTSTIRGLDVQGRLPRNFDRPISKDTIPIPDGGYVIIRFRASNPGFWLAHCHVEHHLEFGMGWVMRFGQNTPALPRNFPTCGNFFG